MDKMLNETIACLNKTSVKENKYWECVLEGKAVEVEVGELLFGLVRACKPKVIVETGTNCGYSALCMIEAIKRNSMGFLYTFDILDLDRIIPKEYSKYYEFISGDSVEEGSKLVRRINDIDFLFLDSSHETNHVIKEFKTFYPKIRTNGVIVFHDTTLDIYEDWAVRNIKDRYRLDTIRLATSRGLDVMIKK